MSKIVKGGRRLRSKMFAELQSHYLFDDRFERPGKGNDKGKVEGLVGYVRRNFMTPLPVAESYDALNARFLDACAKRRQAILRGHRTTIAERMQADMAVFMALPPAPCFTAALRWQDQKAQRRARLNRSKHPSAALSNRRLELRVCRSRS